MYICMILADMNGYVENISDYIINNCCNVYAAIYIFYVAIFDLFWD